LGWDTVINQDLTNLDQNKVEISQEQTDIANAMAKFPVINVKTDYHAKGDGVTDDTAAIQSALNACPVGGRVLLPAGIYRTSAPLVLPPAITLVGSHSNMMVAAGLTNPACYIQPLASFSGVAVIRIEDAATGGYSATPAEHRIFDLMIDGSAYTASAIDGIQCKGNVQNVVLRQVTIRYMSGNGLYTDTDAGAYPYSWRLYSVMVDNCHGHGYALNQMTDITMFDCQAIGCYANGFNLVNLANSQLIGCRAEWNGNYGYYLTGSWGSGQGSGALVMSGCSTDRNGWDGLHVDATGTPPFIFDGLMLRRDGRNGGTGGGGYAGFSSHGATTPIVLSAVTVFPGVDDNGSGTSSPQYGISVAAATTSFSLNQAYVQAATQAIFNDGTNIKVLIGPDVVTATGTTAAPTIAATAAWNWSGTASATHTAAASNILQGSVVGDTNQRVILRADGLMVLGSGTAAPDAGLWYRTGVGGIQTDSYLSINNGGQSNGAFTSWSNTAKAIIAGSAGGGLAIKEGANARMGVATLAAGTVTVPNTSVTATTRVILSRQAAAGTLGQLSFTVAAGTSITINSSSNTETSTVMWMLVEPA
jgi:hypothetical protein